MISEDGSGKAKVRAVLQWRKIGSALNRQTVSTDCGKNLHDGEIFPVLMYGCEPLSLQVGQK